MKTKEQKVHINATEVLQKVSDKLNGLKSISYTLKRELNYPSNNYFSESSWNSYFEFNKNEPVNFKYQIEDRKIKMFYNGVEQFDLNKDNKTMTLTIKAHRESFNNLSFLYNSLISVKYILPKIISDHSMIKILTDTLINKTSYYSVKFFTNKKRIQNLGNDFDDMKVNIIYQVLINKDTYLPFQLLQFGDLNNDFIKTEFNNIKIDIKSPEELSWYYSTYLEDYKLKIEPENSLKSIPTGSLASDWSLPYYNLKENLSINELKGKVILLDFWIKNCGPCIKSIPSLNALKQKYKSVNFEIIGINCYDSKEDIKWFCDKYKPDYNILMNGKSIADNYGISGYPTIVLVDKGGRILYSGSNLDFNDITKLIDKALQQE